MKVIRSRLQEQKSRKSYSYNVKPSIGHNSGSIKHRAMRFACSIWFSAIEDRMVWPPSLSRDRKWPQVTKYTHSRGGEGVDHRLEGSLVIQYAAHHDRHMKLATTLQNTW